MKNMQRIVMLLLLMLVGLGASHAETLYVTDRILLGLHTEASEDSPLVDSVPSGTAVQVLESVEAFKKVRLPNGKTGWVNTGYLVNTKPATAQVDEIAAREEKVQTELKSTKEELAKKNRELQVRSDELSNARTTIQELKKKANNASPAIDTKMAEELAAANDEIEKLKEKLAQAESSAPPEQPVAQDVQQKQPENASELTQRLTQLEADNAALQGRIDMALAHLNGEEMPTAEELALMRPRLPNWMWSLLVLMVIIGIAIGVSWMDFRHRRRHGGFRV